MAAFSNFVGFLLVVLLSSTESETANITALIGKSASPSYAVEGKNFTIEWNYTLDGTIGSVQLVTVNDDGTDTTIGRGFSPGIVSVQGGFQARFKAQATETRAELTILAVQRSDEETYKLIVLPTGTGFISELVILDVNFPPKITKISANQKVIEGGNVTLICLVDGKPTPTITWTRLSDNSVVNMTLTDISRQEAGKYRCTGVNGIGRPARGDIKVAVRYAVKATGCGENATVPYGGNKTFSCPVDGNPKPNITWYMYNEVSERPIFSGENWTAGVTGCYTCVASNYLGTSVSVTQCLTVEESSTASAPSTSAPKHPSRTVIGVLIGVAVFMVILIGLVTCWVCKKKKCGKRTKNAERDYFEVDT